MIFKILINDINNKVHLSENLKSIMFTTHYIITTLQKFLVLFFIKVVPFCIVKQLKSSNYIKRDFTHLLCR